MIAAFFDIDGTIVKENSLITFIKYLEKIGYITKWQVLRAWWLYKKYTWNLIDTHSLSRIMKFVRGKKVSEVKKIMDIVFREEVRPNISKKILIKIKWHKEKGHKIVLLTTTPRELAVLFKKTVKADDVLSSKLAVAKGVYLGKFDFFNFRRAKLDSMCKYARKNKINLKRSYVYTDSYSDRAAMNKVGNPVAVNPDVKLKRYAKKHDWPIIEG